MKKYYSKLFVTTVITKIAFLLNLFLFFLNNATYACYYLFLVITGAAMFADIGVSVSLLIVFLILLYLLCAILTVLLPLNLKRKWWLYGILFTFYMADIVMVLYDALTCKAYMGLILDFLMIIIMAVDLIFTIKKMKKFNPDKQSLETT